MKFSLLAVCASHPALPPMREASPTAWDAATSSSSQCFEHGTNRVPSTGERGWRCGCAERLFWGVHNVHTLGVGLCRTGAGSGRIAYVSGGVAGLQGQECSSSPTLGTRFPPGWGPLGASSLVDSVNILSEVARTGVLTEL